jgi:hypothetical protein
MLWRDDKAAVCFRPCTNHSRLTWEGQPRITKGSSTVLGVMSLSNIGSTIYHTFSGLNIGVDHGLVS